VRDIERRGAAGGDRRGRADRQGRLHGVARAGRETRGRAAQTAVLAEARMSKTSKGRARQDESSAEYFRRSRPKFLDWEPPTEEERQREASARKQAKQRELEKVTRLEKERQAAKKAARGR
jgi:hypothetical protein